MADFDIDKKNILEIREINFEKYKDSLRGRLYFNFFNEEIPVFNLGNILPKKIVNLTNEILYQNKLTLNEPGTYKIILKKY